ncbi:endonuclease domain-containing protein [Trichlorobacter lovleyi]|jgi:Uncharacterized protein conserved in bacteria|uniref:endonuclease domain-containing protein n=1 Tax=Trichlorobacter lovleyi TaxID=313985 RepID=UPI0000E91D1B|nr:endonuclease domain-containing protein [Trichlorobacter lovleyi]
MQKATPLNPPLSGGKHIGCAVSPLPDKGGRGVGFLQYKTTLTSLARNNRKNPTVAEQKMWQELLRNKQFFNYKFTRQKPIGGYIVDFYCSDLQLVIEIDGDSHAEAVEYDAERTRKLEAYGLTVVRYTNHEIMHNLEGVYDDLRRRIKHA